MTSFLLTNKEKKTFQDRLNKKAVSTQNTIHTAIDSFERFCAENYANRKPNEIFAELRILKGEEQTDAIYDVLQSWIDWHYSRDVLTTTLRQYFSSLKQYFHYNGLKLHPQDVKDTLEFKKRIREELYPLQLEDIQKIFKYANPKKISFYLALISTGARPGELLQVRKKDIDTALKRYKIRIEAENVKTRVGRSVFLTKEASERLQFKLKDLEDDALVWGTNENPRHALKNEEMRFNRACEGAGFAERYQSNNIRKIILYSFRSYFFGKAADIHREGYAHKMIGHGGYLPQYDRMNDEKKIEWFIKLEPELTIDDSERLRLKNQVLENEKNSSKRVKFEMNELKTELKASKIQNEQKIGQLQNIVQNMAKEMTSRNLVIENLVKNWPNGNLKPKSAKKIKKPQFK